MDISSALWLILLKGATSMSQGQHYDDGIDRVIYDDTTASTRQHYSEPPTRPHGPEKIDACMMDFPRS